MCTNALLCKENALFRYGGTAGPWQHNRRHFRYTKLTNSTLVHWHKDRHGRDQNVNQNAITSNDSVTKSRQTKRTGIRNVKVKVISFDGLPWRHRGDWQVWHYYFFNIGDRRGWVVNAMPRPLYPEELPVTHSIEGWVSPRDGLDGCGKSLPHPDSISVPSSP
jgi:hypothetical protein